VRKLDDFTAEEARIEVQLAPGSSSDKTIDALYAFTDCEVNISPNCCVVQDKKPIFTSVSDLLRLSVEHTKALLKWELEIAKAELEEQYFFTSLEKIFIENRIYKEEGYENAPDKEKLIAFVDKALDPWKAKLIREVRREDIERLFEIRMIRITRFDSKKADELMRELDKKIKATIKNLKNLTDYTIAWFDTLKSKYGHLYPRRTEVRNFANINIKTVVEANEKLYINRADGFIGTALKKDEYLFNCSDIDEVIIFHKNGKYKVVKVADKVFVGTDIIHIDIYRKNDNRTIYNAIYRDGKGGIYYMKRFAVTGVARDKEYDLTQGKPQSRVMYFTANPNGEAEVIKIQLKPALHLKKMEVIKDLSELAIKSRTARGNVLTKYDVKSITLKQKGHSTLGGRKVWFDPDILRLNYDGQGMYLGEFTDDDRILVITNNGGYYLTNFDLTAHFDQNIWRIEKFDSEKVWSLAMWNADLGYFYGKRFVMDAQTKLQNMLGENSDSKMTILTDRDEALFRITFADENRPPIEVLMSDFIEAKSPKAKGKRFSTLDIAKIEDITPEPEVIEEVAEDDNADEEEAAPIVDVPFTISNEVPEDSKPVDEQLSLF
jgi:topoisomerase-4 subunit A